MKTLPLALDDELDADLSAVSEGQGRTKHEIATEVLRKYVRTERLRLSLQDPKLITLYEELADEDVILAELGMADYQQGLLEADRV